MSPSPNTPRRATRGFTLTEVMISTVMVGVALVSTSWAMAAAGKAHVIEETAKPVTATMVAQEIFELAQNLQREPAGVIGVTSFDEIKALDALIGAEFSPPIRANGEVFTGIDNWTQEVTLDVYGLDDLSAKKLQSALDGLEKTDAKVFQLVVVVKDGAQELDTFRWFLTP